MWLDGSASIVIGLILAATAWVLAIETKDLLIGESASKEVVQGVREMAAGLPGVEHVNEVLTLHMGPDFILVNVGLDFDDTLPAGQVEQTAGRLSRAIKERWPRVKKVFVEAESWQ